MTEQLQASHLLPVACLLCGAPYVTVDWRAIPSPYGVIYLCDDCCQRLGPRKAYIMGRHLLHILTILAHSLQLTETPARPVTVDGKP